MESHFEVPAQPESAWEQIEFIRACLMSLDLKDPDYPVQRAQFQRTLDDLYAQLGQSPAESSISGSRKRSLDSSSESDSSRSKRVSHECSAGPSSPMTADYQFPAAQASSSRLVRSKQADHTRTGMFGANYVDLTGSDDNVIPSQVDPFQELADAYQPGVPQEPAPADSFNQEWMTVDDLAQFLIQPTPAGGGYAYDPQSQAQNGNGEGRSGGPSPWWPPLPASRNVMGQRGVKHLVRDAFGDDDDDDVLPMASTTSEAVEHLIQNLTTTTADDLPIHLREQTPKAMKSQLMEHQKIALTWLRKMEDNPKTNGGILADEMGLGKTVEALSLILANPSTDSACKTTLIIAPVALMRQWEKEIERHVLPSHRLKVYTYHGVGKKATFSLLRKYDVVLTTFGTLSSEMKTKDMRGEARAAQYDYPDSQYAHPGKDTLALLGRECMWYRIIIDEAQNIKNRNTIASKAANDLQGRKRLCMTGTPMMNSIDELYPLIRFLRITPYNDWGRFSYDISRAFRTSRSRLHDRAMNRVQALLKSIMLRRGKTTIVDGQQICQIPPKHTQHDSVEFSKEEQDLYTAVQTHSQLRFNKYLKAGTVNNNYANVLVMLLRLRQICCHPHLIKDLGVQVSTEGIDKKELLSRSRTLSDDVVRRLQNADGFECPICFEADVNPTIIIPCGHTVCGECFQKLVDPARAIQEGRENGEGAAKCPHCRGILSSNKITDWRHFCKAHCPEKLALGLDGDVGDADSDSDEDEDSDDEDIEDDTLGGFIVPDDEDDMDNDASDDAGDKSLRGHNSKGKQKVKSREPKPKPQTTLAQLKKESRSSMKARHKYLKRLQKTWTSSAKIEKTMEILREIKRSDPTEKTLIFSQFTTLLDLLEVPLMEEKFKYQRYDGSMRMKERVDAVNAFMEKADENIMLISLKAGNAGLNLSKASQVIILDPFWNPFIEDQAVDRAHRMPQQREVHVHRVLVPETVEDRICSLQDKKREIINTALDERAGKNLTRLGVRELQYLFGLG